MERRLFDTIIKKNTSSNPNGVVIGNCNGCINGVEFMICDCGGAPGSEYYAYLINGDPSTDKHYDSFEKALNDFQVNGNTILNQIDKLEKFEFIDYTD